MEGEGKHHATGKDDPQLQLRISEGVLANLGKQ